MKKRKSLSVKITKSEKQPTAIRTGKSMKVWGFVCLERFPAEDTSPRQVRTIVRAASKARAVAMLEQSGFCVSLSGFSSRWELTGDRTELEVASEFEEGVWQEFDRSGVNVRFKNLA